MIPIKKTVGLILNGNPTGKEEISRLIKKHREQWEKDHPIRNLLQILTGWLFS